MENESSIKEIIAESLKDVRSVIDADTIVGQPIHLDSGVTIIPISKVSMGFVSGGLDLPTKSEGGSKNFGGGGGTGVSVTPVGFLTVSPEGKVDMLPMTPEKTTSIEQIAELIEHAPDIIDRVKKVFTGKKEEKAEEKAEAATEVERELTDKVLESMAEEEEKALTKEDLRQKAAEEKAAKKQEKEAKKQEKDLKKQEKKQEKIAKKQEKEAQKQEQEEAKLRDPFDFADED